MLQLSKILFDLCRFKNSPDLLPRSPVTLILVVMCGVIIDSFASSLLITRFSTLEIFNTVLVYNLVLLIAVFLLLKIVGYASRALQTMIAVAGSGLVISLILLPALLMLDSSKEQSQAIALFILIDNAWRISVNAYIFRHAFSIKILLSLIISVSYLLLGVMIADFLLPAQAP